MQHTSQPADIFGGERFRASFNEKKGGASNPLNVRLGLYTGVFFPCLQIMFGVVLFLRLPFITGQAGVGYSLLIAGLAFSTALMTVLSLSAIVSNGKISAGGTYYMIARSLGPALGAATGICFYIGICGASAINILGAAEIFLKNAGPSVPNGDWSSQICGIIILVVLFSIVTVGPHYVSRFGIAFVSFIFVGILWVLMGLFSLGSSANSFESSGLSSDTLSDNWTAAFTPDTSFATMFGLFFPGMAGILAGSNRSAFLEGARTCILNFCLIMN